MLGMVEMEETEKRHFIRDFIPIISQYVPIPFALFGLATGEGHDFDICTEPDAKALSSERLALVSPRPLR